VVGIGANRLVRAFPVSKIELFRSTSVRGGVEVQLVRVEVELVKVNIQPKNKSCDIATNLGTRTHDLNSN
jgi:hypothetical protein